MTQTLTIPETLATVRKALAENRLSAQHGGYGRYLDDNGYPCAIGACLTEDLARVVGSRDYIDVGVLGLEHDRFVKLTGNERFYGELQDAHDRWGMGSATQADFIATLDALEAKYLGAAQ